MAARLTHSGMPNVPGGCGPLCPRQRRLRGRPSAALPSHLSNQSHGAQCHRRASTRCRRFRIPVEQRGSSFLASIKEVAHFDLVDGRVQGKDYVYELKSLVKRRREVQFLPQQGLIKSLRKDQWTEHEWAPEVLDRFSQQEQLRLDLISAAAKSESDEAPSELSFTVVDGDRIKIRTLDLVAEETLTTPLGDLNTLHYRQRRDSGSNRSSDIWVAPSLDFMMVLTQHVEDDSVIEIALQALSVAPAAAD